MYKLNFIEKVEKEMQSLLARKDKYMTIKTQMLQIQEDIKKMYSEAKNIKNKDSKEYLDLIEKAKTAEKRHNNLYKLLKTEEERFEKIKQYILKNLKINKAIIEKYKDAEDDKDIKEFKKGLQKYNYKEDLVDQKMVELSEKLKFNDLSADEIKSMDPEKRKKINEAKEQYLNNRKQFEKHEKIKYVILLGNDTAKNRIFQYESAIADIEKNFSIENIEETITRLEETLKIEKQRPEFIFDEKTHLYKYIDERGKTYEYDYFKKEENGKYKSKLTDTFVKTADDSLKAKGLSKRQIKTLDKFLLRALMESGRDDLYEDYIQSIKDGKEPKFNLKYVTTKEIEKEEKIDKKDLNKIINSAKKQEKLGIATIVKEKKKNKLFKGRDKTKVSGTRSLGKRIRAALLTLGFGATIFAGAKYLNPANENEITKEESNGTLENNKDNLNINKNVDKTEQKDNVNNTQKDEERDNTDSEQENKETENEMTPGDYAKISERAMLFRDPTDWIRMKNGLNANEKVQIKNSSSDKLYKITKIGYYSPTGEFITIEAGQNLENSLKEKGLDKSFIEDENTVVMYHTVAEGIAQWVNADDVEKVEVRVDKFGNVVDKTEEQKIVDEAMEHYYEQYNTTKQQTTSKTTSKVENTQKNEKNETVENQQDISDTEGYEQEFNNSVDKQTELEDVKNDSIERVDAEIVSDEEYTRQLQKDIRNANSKREKKIKTDAKEIKEEERKTLKNLEIFPSFS